MMFLLCYSHFDVGCFSYTLYFVLLLSYKYKNLSGNLNSLRDIFFLKEGELSYYYIRQ